MYKFPAVAAVTEGVTLLTCDVPSQAEVSSEDAEALTRQLRLRFYRTCVKDNLNVSEGSKRNVFVGSTKSDAPCCSRICLSVTKQPSSL